MRSHICMHLSVCLTQWDGYDPEDRSNFDDSKNDAERILDEEAVMLDGVFLLSLCRRMSGHKHHRFSPVLRQQRLSSELHWQCFHCAPP